MQLDPVMTTLMPRPVAPGSVNPLPSQHHARAMTPTERIGTFEIGATHRMVQMACQDGPQQLQWSWRPIHMSRSYRILPHLWYSRETTDDDPVVEAQSATQYAHQLPTSARGIGASL